MPPPSSLQMAVCLNLTRALSHTHSLAEIYDAALDALQQGLNISRAAILLFDPDGVMRFKAWRGLSDNYRRAVEGHTPWSPDTPNPEPIVVGNAANEPSLSKVLPAIRAEGIGALAFIPLVSRDRVIGKFMLYDASPEHFENGDLQLALVIASQVAFAVERRRAEDEASRSASRLRFALDAANMGTWDWDLATNTVRWSDNLERIHGAPPGTFDGTFASYAREIHPDDRARVGASIDRAFRDGTLHHVEYRIVAQDGTVRWVEGKGAIERGPDGAPAAMSGVCMDITPRKTAEADRTEALEQSNRASRHLAAIVQSSGDAIVSKNLDGIITSWNRAAEQLFGYSADEAIGRSIMLIIPDDRLSEEAFVLSRVRAGQTAEMETIRERKDGTLVPISLVVSPITDEHGNIVGASKVARDITTRKQQEAERAELQRRLAFLAETTAILSRSLDYSKTLDELVHLAVPTIADWCTVDVFDLAGDLKRIATAHADPAMIELGREFARLYPRTLPGNAHDVARTGTTALVTDVTPVWIASVTQDEGQAGMLRRFGLTSYATVPLPSAGGPIGAMSFAMAESGRHFTERDVSFLQDVAARAALAIQNGIAYQRVNEANRLKDEFLATLSHELRTPLNAILGYAQMMKMGAVPPNGVANATAVITRNAESLKQIIHDVLDVSRITSGKLRLNVQPVDLREIIGNAIATVRPAADARGVAIQFTFDANLPSFAGDPDRLQQIVWNLLSNAVKFTPEGGHVRASVHGVKGAVEIVVSDNGQGIDPDFLPHMFERFRQADSRFAREHGGLGLGLAIVRDLTELHGGTVTAQSDGLQRGATFTVRLPLAMSYAAAPVEAAHVPAVADREAISDLPPSMLRGRRILAVDDEPDSLALLRLILESTGAVVTTADSAVDALDLLRQRQFDALIADIGMPGMDGLEMMRNIRRSLPAPANAMPAAALTAYARSEDRATALANGFQVHLTKPVNAVDLVATMAALMS